MIVSNINPKEGDIIFFWSNDAQKQKFAINLEPEYIHKHKPTFNGVMTTTQKVNDIYPLDYKLPDTTMKKPTKVICDQSYSIPKSSASHIQGSVTDKDLEEIRKRVAESYGIGNYSNTTS